MSWTYDILVGIVNELKQPVWKLYQICDVSPHIEIYNNRDVVGFRVVFSDQKVHNSLSLDNFNKPFKYPMALSFTYRFHVAVLLDQTVRNIASMQYWYLQHRSYALRDHGLLCGKSSVYLWSPSARDSIWSFGGFCFVKQEVLGNK